MKWTETQLEAIETRGKTLLVSAGAGSGKTAVLTARILSLLREGVQIDELLVVTFTRAAAAEMRQRILAALHEAASNGDKNLASQAMRIERADITTLHGFCAKICKEHFQTIQSDPMFRVGDPAETSVLRESALLEALLQCYESPSADFSYAASCLTQEQLAVAVGSLYDCIMARPDPWAWLDWAIDISQSTEQALETSVWVNILFEGARAEIEQALLLYEQLLTGATGIPKYETYVLGEMQYARSLHSAAKSGLAACGALLPKPVTKKPMRPKGTEDALEAWFASVNKRAKDHLNKACKTIEWLLPMQSRKEALDISAIMLRGIAEAARVFDKLFQQAKSMRNILDYHDLEHGALQALRHDEIANDVRSKYRHVFIDEYQDSSLLQEEIVGLVCRPDALFMVGDVKQSIYSFRLAEPSLFLTKMRAYAKGKAMCGNVFLSENFRSHPIILDCVNDIFSAVFCGGQMEIQYDDQARLRSGTDSDWKGAPVELHIFRGDGEDAHASDDSDEEPDGESPEEQTAIQQEACLIARRIIALRNAPEKNYRLRDMAILLRVVRGKASQVADVLRRFGIPAKVDIGEDTLQQVEVQDVVSLLKCIDNIHLDIPFIASLRGPALGLSPEDIARIRIAHPEGSFAEAALAYCQKEDALSAALNRFLERINGWAMEALVCPLDTLIRKIYEESGAYTIAGALPVGTLRQDNLCLLAETASIYQQQETGGLGGFLRYLDRAQARDGGMTATNLGGQEDIVRIMSIHKSKGLQFPVVFVAGLGGKFYFQDTKNILQIHSQLGIGIQAIDPILRTKQDTVIRKAILQRKKQEALAEQARILYVALTRAKARLILIGTERKGRIADTPRGGNDATRACAALDWILPVATDESRWHVHIHPMENTVMQEQQRKTLQALVDQVRGAPPPFPGSAAVRALSWQAPKAAEQPLKQSVTTRIRQTAEDLPKMEELPVRPLFMEAKGLTPAERGDAVHTYLRTIPIGEKDFASACQDMVARGILSPEQANALPAGKLQAFLDGALWDRICRAKVMHREWPFNLRTQQNEATSLLQGVIDCCFVEDKTWVLVDYKTDYGSAETLLQRYKPQIELYASALAQLTGMTVRQRILYAITMEQAYEV